MACGNPVIKACKSIRLERELDRLAAWLHESARFSYLARPSRALVLNVDEKGQIQAVDREQPLLPMMLGVPERRTHACGTA
jgi:hypothetical protein